MKRRAFITLIGGAAAWPVATRAQQPERMRRIFVLMGTANDAEAQARVEALHQGLQVLGWTMGRNIQINYSFGSGDVERMRVYAKEAAARLGKSDLGLSASGSRSRLSRRPFRGTDSACRTRRCPPLLRGIARTRCSCS
jgi:hypothetical protein